MSDEVITKLNDRTVQQIESLQADWECNRQLEGVEYGPIPWHRDAPPRSVDDQLEEFAGMAAVVVFRTDRRREMLLVYNRAGHWEPPGGAIEGRDSPAETAVREATEEVGVAVDLQELLFVRPVTYHYEDGSTVTFPAVTFLGIEIDGSIRPERADSVHPYASHGVGVFGRDVLPENCRDRPQLLDSFSGLPPYDPKPEPFA